MWFGVVWMWLGVVWSVSTDRVPTAWTGEFTSLRVRFCIKRLHSCLNIMSLVAVEKRKSGKNRKDRNKVDRKVRKKGKFPACVFSSSLGAWEKGKEILCVLKGMTNRSNQVDFAKSTFYFEISL